VLHLVGDGAWEMHEAGAYRFDEPVADARTTHSRLPPASKAA